VNFAFNEEQLELREMARAFLTEHSGSEQVRAAMETAAGYDPKVWDRVGAELGWTAVTIGEAHGGLGLGTVELVALMETMGEALFCSPFFATICLAATAIGAAGTEAQKAALLPGIAEGATRATLAWTEAAGSWDCDAIATTATPEGGGHVLAGEKHFVVDGHSADLLVLAARAPGSEGAAGVSLFAVPSATPGVHATPVTTMDATRRLARVSLDGVRVDGDALLGAAGHGSAALERTRHLAAIGLAAEQVGGAQRCLDMAVAYSLEREQYGRPIGSFQALKHTMADMMVDVESARSAVYYAACAADAGSDDLAALSSMAKAVASDAYQRCAGDALQIFGGVGFTFEYDIHLYFKRARSTAAMLGDAAEHRERVARELGL